MRTRATAGLFVLDKGMTGHTVRMIIWLPTPQGRTVAIWSRSRDRITAQMPGNLFSERVGVGISHQLLLFACQITTTTHTRPINHCGREAGRRSLARRDRHLADVVNAGGFEMSSR